MNANDSKTPSETNWARIEQMTDEQIDTSDIPELGEEFFARARWRKPTGRVPVTLDVDADVWEWFNAQGDEAQRRINAALRIYADAHREQRP